MSDQHVPCGICGACGNTVYFDDDVTIPFVQIKEGDSGVYHTTCLRDMLDTEDDTEEAQP